MSTYLLDQLWNMGESTYSGGKALHRESPELPTVNPADYGSILRFMRTSKRLPTRRFFNQQSLSEADVRHAEICDRATKYAQDRYDRGIISTVEQYRATREHYITLAYSFRASDSNIHPPVVIQPKVYKNGSHVTETGGLELVMESPAYV